MQGGSTLCTTMVQLDTHLQALQTEAAPAFRNSPCGAPQAFARSPHPPSLHSLSAELSPHAACLVHAPHPFRLMPAQQIQTAPDPPTSAACAAAHIMIVLGLGVIVHLSGCQH